MKQRLSVAILAASLSALGSAQTPDLYDIDTVRDVYLTFSQPNYWTLLLNNYASETNIPADMRVDGVTYPQVGVRFRGNTSYFQLPPNSEKKSFNIETDFFVPGQDLYGYEHLNFNNGFHDPTFLREFLTYYGMRRHGPAPLCNFIRLHLNGTYWGVYINVQQPNKDMMRLWWRSNDGNRYRGFPTSGGFSNGRTALAYLGTNVADYLSAYQAKQGDGLDLMNMISVLNNTPAANIQTALPPVFSVDQFYRYTAVMNVFGQDDSYIGSGKDHFLYRDPTHGDFHMFPFDLNEALANSTSYNPYQNTTLAARPAFAKTIPVVPDWRERYKAHIRTVVEQTFNTTHLVPLAQRFHTLLAPMVAADTKKIYSTTLFTNNLTASVSLGGVGGNTIPGIIPYIQGRETFLRNHVDFSPPRTTLTALAHSPVNPNPTNPVTITVTASSHATAVRLWWRKIGPFQMVSMFDDGQHGDGAANDGVWGAILAAQLPGSLIDYYVEAKTATGLATYLPYTAENRSGQFFVNWPTGTSPIRINEFVAQNVTGIVDENNQNEDWIELYNDSAAPVNVGGMWVTDEIAQPKFQLPANTTIPANGTLLIWADEDGTQGPLHANFKLSSNGETVALFAADGITLLDRIDFGLQVADVATGRMFDGAAPWVTFPVPTPRARNELAGCGTRNYGALDSRSHTARISLSASPRIGTTPNLQIASAPANGLAGVFLALDPLHIDLGTFGLAGEFLLLNPLTLAGPVYLPIDASGNVVAGLPIPAAPNLVGNKLYLQAICGGATVDASNALQMVICP